MNFSPSPYVGYPIWLPEAGTWREILNTDAGEFDGLNQYLNTEPVEAIAGENAEEWAHTNITVPPLGAVFLVYEPKK